MTCDVLATLGRLAAKSGVGLGGLGAFERDVALAFAAGVLSPGIECDEAAINALLRECLADDGRWLDVDHAELRRWLVDRGLWQRDGFGRAYRRVPPERLDEALRGIVVALPERTELQRWLATERDRTLADRAARRRRWEAGHAASAGAGPRSEPGGSR